MPTKHAGVMVVSTSFFLTAGMEAIQMGQCGTGLVAMPLGAPGAEQMPAALRQQGC